MLNQKIISVLSVINGGRFDIGATKLIEKVMEITNRFRQLQIDRTELVCLKFLILFEVKELVFNYLTSFDPNKVLFISSEQNIIMKTFKRTRNK